MVRHVTTASGASGFSLEFELLDPVESMGVSRFVFAEARRRGQAAERVMPDEPSDDEIVDDEAAGDLAVAG